MSSGNSPNLAKNWEWQQKMATDSPEAAAYQQSANKNRLSQRISQMNRRWSRSRTSQGLGGPLANPNMMNGQGHANGMWQWQQHQHQLGNGQVQVQRQQSQQGGFRRSGTGTVGQSAGFGGIGVNDQIVVNGMGRLDWESMGSQAVSRQGSALIDSSDGMSRWQTKASDYQGWDSTQQKKPFYVQASQMFGGDNLSSGSSGMGTGGSAGQNQGQAANQQGTVAVDKNGNPMSPSMMMNALVADPNYKVDLNEIDFDEVDFMPIGRGQSYNQSYKNYLRLVLQQKQQQQMNQMINSQLEELERTRTQSPEMRQQLGGRGQGQSPTSPGAGAGSGAGRKSLGGRKSQSFLTSPGGGVGLWGSQSSGNKPDRASSIGYGWYLEYLRKQKSNQNLNLNRTGSMDGISPEQKQQQQMKQQLQQQQQQQLQWVQREYDSEDQRQWELWYQQQQLESMQAQLRVQQQQLEIQIQQQQLEMQKYQLEMQQQQVPQEAQNQVNNEMWLQRQKSQKKLLENRKSQMLVAQWQQQIQQQANQTDQKKKWLKRKASSIVYGECILHDHEDQLYDEGHDHDGEGGHVNFSKINNEAEMAWAQEKMKNQKGGGGGSGKEEPENNDSDSDDDEETKQKKRQKREIEVWKQLQSLNSNEAFTDKYGYQFSKEQVRQLKQNWANLDLASLQDDDRINWARRGSNSTDSTAASSSDGSKWKNVHNIKHTGQDVDSDYIIIKDNSVFDKSTITGWRELKQTFRKLHKDLGQPGVGVLPLSPKSKKERIMEKEWRKRQIAMQQQMQMQKQMQQMQDMQQQMQENAQSCWTGCWSWSAQAQAQQQLQLQQLQQQQGQQPIGGGIDEVQLQKLVEQGQLSQDHYTWLLQQIQIQKAQQRMEQQQQGQQQGQQQIPVGLGAGDLGSLIQNSANLMNLNLAQLQGQGQNSSGVLNLSLNESMSFTNKLSTTIVLIVGSTVMIMSMFTGLFLLFAMAVDSSIQSHQWDSDSASLVLSKDGFPGRLVLVQKIQEILFDRKERTSSRKDGNGSSLGSTASESETDSVSKFGAGK